MKQEGSTALSPLFKFQDQMKSGSKKIIVFENEIFWCASFLMSEPVPKKQRSPVVTFLTTSP